MNNSIEYHHLDTRSPEEKQENLIFLNIIQDVLEQQISSYALENPENLFDVEYQEIIRKLEFSQGMNQYIIVLTPDGFIRAISKPFPIPLLQEIHNILSGLDFTVPHDRAKE